MKYTAYAVYCLLLVGGASGASEPERIGFGMRSAALGGTGAAYADDFEAVYANPAGLAWSEHRRLTVGLVKGIDSVRLDGAPRAISDTDGLLLGVDLPLPLGGPLRDRVALGLGFYLPLGLINRARAPFPDQTSLPLFDSNTQTVSVMVAASVRLTDRLSIGGGVLALAALVGKISLGVDGAMHVVSKSEEQLVADYAPVLGASFRPSERWRLGLVFRGRSESRYDLVVTPDVKALVGFDLPPFRIQGVSQYDPLQVALEAAFAPRRSLLLVAQLAWKKWSDFPHPVENATDGAAPLPPTGFHDTLVPRLAVEHRERLGRVDLVVRGGYFFEWSPAPAPSPSDAPMRTLLDADRHVFTIGWELALHNRVAPLHLESFLQWHQLAPNARVSGHLAVAGISLGAEL